MTYPQAVYQLKQNPSSEAIDGHKVPSIIRRRSWPDGKVIAIANGQVRIAFANINESTGRHQAPELAHEVFVLKDLGAKDWEYVDGTTYF